MEKNIYNNKLNLVDSLTAKNNTLPHDNEAEEILLGAPISDNNCIEFIENGLSDFHFYIPMLGRIFKAVLELANKDQIANPLTLDHYFADDSSFKEIGNRLTKKVKVKVISIKNALKNITFKKNYPLLLKIDIEGLEKEVLSNIDFRNDLQIKELIVEGTGNKEYINKKSVPEVINGFIEKFRF